MPDYTFTGPTPHTFPESRHSDGTPVRSVEPGEIRDLPRAIDHQWRETTEEDRAAWAALLAAREVAGEAARAETAGEPAGATAQPEAAPPAAPARPRKDRTLSASDAGTPGGSEG